MFGEYWMDIPKKNTFTFYDESGNVVSNAKISLHNIVGQGYGNGFVSEKVRLTGITDKSGSWTVSKPLYDEQVCWMTNAALFFVLETKDGEEFGGFTDASELNLEYWRGNKNDAHVAVIVKPVPEIEEE
jgi:hypothetical protein